MASEVTHEFKFIRHGKITKPRRCANTSGPLTNHLFMRNKIMAAADLTAERLRELLHYDPETGVFTRLVSLNFAVNVGDVAGTLMKKGYWSIGVDKHKYKAHRLAWLYMTGSWPKEQIDHINGNRIDNRFSNLRECTNQENQQNIPVITKATGRLVGTCFRKDRGMWSAAIICTPVRKHLGFFATQEEAHQAYLKAKAELHTFCPTIVRSK